MTVLQFDAKCPPEAYVLSNLVLMFWEDLKNVEEGDWSTEVYDV